jgi:hypothetical protein
VKKIVALTIVLLALFLSGCPITGQAEKGAGDEVGSSAVDEVTGAVSDNVNKEVREGVNNAFENIFD